jgi:protein kinase C substrate 80K-H
MKEEKQKLKEEAEAAENLALEVYRKAEEEQRKSKQEAEAQENRREAEETFNRYDSNQNGFLEIIEVQTRIVFDRNRDGAVDEEEARFFLAESDQLDLENFITLAWPKIKPFLMLEAGLFKPPATEEPGTDSNSDSEPERERGDQEPPTEQDDGEIEEAELVNPEEEEIPGDMDEDEDYEDHEHGDGYVKPDEHDHDEHHEDLEPPKPEYDPETQELISKATEARNQFNQADRELRDLDKEIQELHDALDKDFGPEDEFGPLSGECFSYEDREYIYKFCPFDRASQQPKAGGSETR